MNLFKAAVAATFLAIVPASAQAATVMVTSIGFDTPGYRTGQITYTPTNLVINNVGIGRFNLTGTDTATMTAAQYLTFCVDIFHGLHTGQFTTPGLGSFVNNPTKVSQLTAFVGNASAQIASAGTAAARKDASAATQLGVWEILYEGSGSYNLNAGNFFVSNGDSANARALATNWLANVTSGGWQSLPNKQLGFLFNQSNQSQIFLNSVPEPASWAMMMIGFGLIGGALRRAQPRRQLGAVAA